ncbi:MAG: hypothetical protein WCI73_01605 [Phycisphaerae bacterium]
MVLAGLGFGGYRLYGLLGRSAEARDLNRRWMVCTQTKKPFQVDLDSLKGIPAPSPFSGRNTGQPAELCFWTADGKPKTEPTPVLLNQYLNDPAPTFCPDCGRLVVARNPGPDQAASPPPTKAEYEARWSRGAR